MTGRHTRHIVLTVLAIAVMSVPISAQQPRAPLTAEDLAAQFKAAFQLGSDAMQASNHEEAIKQFTVAIGILDSCYNCYQNIGISHLGLGNNEEAEAAFKQVIALRPDYANAYINLSSIYNSQRRFDEAAEINAEALRLSGAGGDASADPIAVYNQGIIYLNARKFIEAQSQFEQTIALDPNHAEANFFLAMTNLSQGTLAETLAALEAYVELAPSGQYAERAERMIPPILHQFGTTLQGIGGGEPNYVEAVLWFRRAAEEYLHWESMLSLGTMYEVGMGVPEDYVLAHMWYNLAASYQNGLKSNEAEDRSKVAAKMTPAQIAEAQRLAREWNAEHPREP